MQKKTDSPQDLSMQEALRLAQSPAGQQLLAILRQSGGEELRQAMASAATGDYQQAKQTLGTLLNTPEVKALLEQLGR